MLHVIAQETECCGGCFAVNEGVESIACASIALVRVSACHQLGDIGNSIIRAKSRRLGDAGVGAHRNRPSCSLRS